MKPTNVEDKTILSKCLSFIDKTQGKLRQLDTLRFPTTSSESALQLISDSLDQLKDPVSLAPVDPAVLYKALFAIQELVQTVERSSTAHISWPLVNYCDAIWERFFGESGPRIFYSVTPEHNYTIERFSKRLASTLRGLLPSAKISKLTS